MCAPKVMQYVNQKLSRRDLFKLAAGGAAAGAAVSLGMSGARAHKATHRMEVGR